MSGTLFIAPELLAETDADGGALGQAAAAGLMAHVFPPREAGTTDEGRVAHAAAAAAAAGAAPGASFLVTDSWRDAADAERAGLRGIFVTGDAPLGEVLGPSEPEAKHVAIAPDVATAIAYAACEAATAASVGPFPFGAPAETANERARFPSQRDLARFLGLVVLTGTTIALGIAYFLRELYESWRLPANAQPFVSTITLQFMPEWARGLLFLLLGVALGFLASRARHALTAASARRRGA